MKASVHNPNRATLESNITVIMRGMAATGTADTCRPMDTWWLHGKRAYDADKQQGNQQHMYLLLSKICLRRKSTNRGKISSSVAKAQQSVGLKPHFPLSSFSPLRSFCSRSRESSWRLISSVTISPLFTMGAARRYHPASR